MKKIAIATVALMMAAAVSHAALTMAWIYNGNMNSAGRGTFGDGWLVKMYAMNGSVKALSAMGYIPFETGILYLGLSTPVSAGSRSTFFGESMLSADAAAGKSVFTVVFDPIGIGAGARTIILDGSPFAAPASGEGVAYQFASIANDWKTVPEPGTLALGIMGLGALALRRFRKK